MLLRFVPTVGLSTTISNVSTPLVFGPDGIDDEQIVGKPPPSTRFLNWLHTRVSTNRPEDTHHRLGYGPTEAAPGNHTHDGRDSLPIAGVADLTEQVTALEAIALANLNRIINGSFRVNQRAAASGASLTNGQYFLDRWYNSSGVASTAATWTGDDVAGRTITLANNAAFRGIAQKIEQTNIPAGEYTLAHDGTAQCRAYKSGGSAPAFADGPVTFTSDGSGDWVIEFTNAPSGTARTVQNVRVLPGAKSYPFIGRLISEELALCQRYFYIIPILEALALNPYRAVALTGGPILGEKHPVVMRASPSVTVAPTDPFPAALNFQFLPENAGANLARILTNNASTTVRLVYFYSTGNNGGSTLTAGYNNGRNTKEVWVSAEL